MIKMMPMSPSSLHLFDQCPRRYQNKYVTKEFPVREFGGPQAERGTILHGLLEHTLKHGYTEGLIPIKLSKRKTVQASWLQYQPEWERCKDAVGNIQDMMRTKWDVFVEMEIATDGNGKMCGWWDEQCFMRAKVDVFLISPDKSTAIIWDWKTGQAKHINPHQFNFIGLTLVPEFGLRNYGAMDFLIDAAEGEQGRPFVIPVDRALPKYLASDQYASSPLAPTIDAIKQLQEAHVLNKWTEKKSFCGNCEVKSCINQGKR